MVTCPECGFTHAAVECVSSLPRFLVAVAQVKGFPTQHQGMWDRADNQFRMLHPLVHRSALLPVPEWMEEYKDMLNSGKRTPWEGGGVAWRKSHFAIVEVLG